MTDDEIPAFLTALGIPGIVDAHVHFRAAVLLHAGAVADGSGNEQWCGPEPVRRLLRRFPRLRLVIAHLGAPDFGAFVALADNHPGVWLDTAMVFVDPPYLGPAPLHLAGRLAGLGDRIVFGSDFPTIPSAYAAQVSGVAGLGLGDAWLRGVLWHNGAALFGLAPPVPHPGGGTGKPPTARS